MNRAIEAAAEQVRRPMMAATLEPPSTPDSWRRMSMSCATLEAGVAGGLLAGDVGGRSAEKTIRVCVTFSSARSGGRRCPGNRGGLVGGVGVGGGRGSWRKGYGLGGGFQGDCAGRLCGFAVLSGGLKQDCVWHPTTPSASLPSPRGVRVPLLFGRLRMMAGIALLSGVVTDERTKSVDGRSTYS